MEPKCGFSSRLEAVLSDLTTCLDGRGHAWEVFLINPKDGKVEECTRQRGNQGFLTRQTFVSKVMSLLFNTLSKLVITFLPRSKCLLI